jgi:hypothetical protein
VIISQVIIPYAEKMPPERLPWQTYSYPIGRRDIGRPRRRWIPLTSERVNGLNPGMGRRRKTDPEI